MSDLECNHCGNIAFTSRDYHDGIYWFTDGEGEKCRSCGMPGMVLVDDADEENVDVTWSDTQENGVYCERPDCEGCDEMRVEEGKAAALFTSDHQEKKT